MRSILCNLVLAPAVMATAALATTSAMAATTLNVPFSFTVDGKKCPAGVYAVERDGIRHMVTLQGKGQQQSFMWLVGPGDSAPADAYVVLRFDELGQTHVLRSVQYGSKITSRLDAKTGPRERTATQVAEEQ
jgi:hypothetical protein